MSEPVPPWGLDCRLDETVAARAVAEQLPGLAAARPRLLHEGWDHRVFELEGGWILRMPKRADVVPALEMERALLPRLAARLGVAVPRPEHFGAPGRHYPHPFSAYRKLPGVLADSLGAAAFATPGNARRLAELLSHLHATPLAEARACGVPDLTPERQPAERLGGAIAGLDEVCAQLAPEQAPRVRRFLEARVPPPPAPGPPVLCHADLDLEHLLLDEETGAISGVIDWSDAGIGDPVQDLVAFRVRCGAAFVDRVLADYRAAAVDPGLAERVEDAARCAWVVWVAETLAIDPRETGPFLACFESVFPAGGA